MKKYENSEVCTCMLQTLTDACQELLSMILYARQIARSYGTNCIVIDLCMHKLKDIWDIKHRCGWLVIV